MRALALTAALILLPVVVVPGTAAALIIPLADSSTFSGTVDAALLRPTRTDGYPNGGSTGSISFNGVPAPSRTVQVTALDLSQDFTFGYDCTVGYICPQSFLFLPVTLALEEPGAVVIDGEGHASGQLRVIISAQGTDAAATLLLRTPRRTTGTVFNPGVEDARPSLRIQGTLQFDNPQSPFAKLQGVTLVAEPPITALVMGMALVLALMLLTTAARRAPSSSPS